MQEPALTPTWLRVLSLASIIALAPAALPQDESDPWFSETREVKDIAAEEEPSKSLVQTGTDSWATYRRIMSDYKNTPDENLNGRIRLLKAAMSSFSKSIDKHQDELASLEKKLDSIKAQLSRADLDGLSVEQQIALVSADRRHFLADTTLLIELLNSKLMQSIERKLGALGRNGEFERLERLEQEVATQGLNSIMGDRFETVMRLTLNGHIERRWQKSKVDLGAPAGADYLVGRLINAPGLKLTLRVITPADADEALRTGIRKGIEQRWVNDFNVVMDDQPPRTADLQVEIDLNAIDTQVSEQSATVASTIPGQITEEPNPDFLALSKKYEKAARRFQVALDAYGASYEEYLRQFEDGYGDHLQNQLDSLDDTSAPPPPPSGGPESAGQGESFAESTARNIEEVTSNSAQSISVPEPRMPEPTHLKILEDLYEMPSTIVTSGESTEYQYLQRKLKYTFRSETVLEMKSHTGATLQAKDTVELQQERVWTKNEGVRATDPTVTEGDFSTHAINSAKLLFGLEFGARCARSIGSLLDETASKLQTDPSATDLEKTLLSLSISVQRGDHPKFALNAQELRALARLAEDPTLSNQEFQEECLRLIAKKGDLQALSLSGT